MGPCQARKVDPGLRVKCICVDPDPAIARTAKRDLVSMLVDESHFIVSVLSCAECGQKFLSVFTEQIDWAGGDDSQARTLVPLDEDGAQQLLSQTTWDESRLLDLEISARMLVWTHPTGQTPSVVWVEGPLQIPRHD